MPEASGLPHEVEYKNTLHNYLHYSYNYYYYRCASLTCCAILSITSVTSIARACVATFSVCALGIFAAAVGASQAFVHICVVYSCNVR